MGDFQTQVNNQPALAVAGDFASANPRASVLAGAGSLVAAVGGLTVGAFAWVDALYQQANNNMFPGSSQAPNGFVGRQGNMGVITSFLGAAGMVIPQGYPVTLFEAGDFWIVNNGSTPAVPGQKAFANLANGLATFAAAGTSATTATSTASTIAAATGVSVTGSIKGTTFTAASGLTGLIYPGTVLTGTNVVTGTTVVAQLTGTAGGLGTYEVNIDQTVASTAISGTCGVLTVGGTVAGVWQIGAIVAGGTVTAGTRIWGLGTGTGGAGTYYVSPSQTVTSAALTATTNVETGWYARSHANVGEMVKISSYPMG